MAFIFDPSKGETPESVARKREIAEALAASAIGRAPRNVGEGLNAVGQALAFRRMMGQIGKSEAAGREQASGAFAPIIAALSGGGVGGGSTGVPDASVPMDPASARVAQAHNASGDPSGYRDAIASIESAGSGDYSAIGPTHPKMGRALGRYQVMEANIGPWSEAALGQAVTPEQFLADPKLQDTIFDHQFGQYVQKFGPEGAAQAWFAGPGGVGKTDRQDVLGTNVGEYGKRFTKALNGGGYQGPGATIAPQDVEAMKARAPTDGSPYSGPGATFAPGDVQKLTAERQAREQAEMDAQTPPWMLDMIRGGQQASGPASQMTPDMVAQSYAQTQGLPQPAPQQQIAQALGQNNPGNIGMMGPEGNVVQAQGDFPPPPQQGGQGPTIQMLLQAAQNPWLNDNQRAIVNMLLEKQLAGPGEGFTLGEGQVRFDANGRPVARGGEKPPAKPSAVQEYEYAKEQGFPGTFQDWEASKKGGMSLTVDPATGQVSFQQGTNIKPLTEGQSKDTVFATRAEGALPLIDKFGDALTSLPETMGSQVPGVGNYMKSPEFQQAEQAGKEFLQAILRKDTGAAITAQETDEYGTVYLPRPGDSPEVLAQKKVSRQRALDAIKAGMPAQAILMQEKALANTGQQPAPGKKPPIVTDDGYTIEEIP